MSDPTSRIVFRRGTSAEWAEADPTLRAGEPAFDTETGLFKIGDGFSVYSELPEVVPRGITPFSDRASALSAKVPSAVLRSIAVMSAIGVMFFVPDAAGTALTTADGANWSPDLAIHGGAYPEHFAAGDTADDVAVQAAVDWADSLPGTGLSGQPGFQILFGPRVHTFTATVAIPSTLDGVGFDGPGKGASLQTGLGLPIFDCGDPELWSGGDTADTGPGYAQRFRNLLFINSSSTANATAVRMGRCPVSAFGDCLFFGFDIAVDGYRLNQTRIEGCSFYTGTRTANAKAFIRMQGVYDSSNDHTPGGGVHVSRCEFIGGQNETQQCALLVHAVDGLYLSQNHAHFIKYSLQFEPTNTLQNNKITDVQVDHFYFDDPLTGGVNVRLIGIVSHNIAAGAGLYQNFSFTGCLFRGANKANYGLVVSVTDGGGFVAGRGPVRDIVLNAGEFRQHVVNAIAALGVTDGRIGCELSCNQVAFDEGNVGAGAATAYVKWEGIYVSLTACKFGPVTNTASRAVHLILSDGQGTPSYNVHGNDFTRCGCTSFVLYDKSAPCRGNASGNNMAGRGERREELRSAATTNYDGKALWSYDFQLDNEIVRVAVEADTTATDGSDHNASYDCRATFRRKDDGSVEELRRTTDLEQTTLLNNLAPLQLVMMTGEPWVADMALAVGDTVVNGGNVYLVILSDGAAGATGPTTPIGAQMFQGVRYLYLGPENTSRLALVVSGQDGVSLYHQAEILMKALA